MREADQTHLRYGWLDGKLEVQQKLAGRMDSRRIWKTKFGKPGVSRDMVRHVLRTMKDEGLITPEGKGRAARWRRSADGPSSSS